GYLLHCRLALVPYRPLFRSRPGADFLKNLIPTVTAASGWFGLFVAFGVAQVGSLFSADAWNNIGFTAGEVKNPKRDVALSMALGDRKSTRLNSSHGNISYAG